MTNIYSAKQYKYQLVGIETMTQAQGFEPWQLE